MKRHILSFLIVIFCGAGLMSQEPQQDETNKDEIKINVFNLVAFKYLDGAYERMIDEESSFGIGVLVNAGNDDDIFEYHRQFSLTPYYRRYFSKGFASGFFVEGFGMLNSGEQDLYTFNEITQETERSGENYTDFAIGVSVGGKFISKKGFVAEVYGGIGRNFFNTEFSPEVVPRGGISLGFRF